MEPLVLYMNQDIQNLLVGVAKVEMGAKKALDIQLRLLLIHNLRLSCKAWKTIVNKITEHNALRLAQYEYVRSLKDVIRVCLPRGHNLITQFQHNLMWFSCNRHVSSKFLRKILMSDLGDLSLQKSAKLRDELEMSLCAVEFYGMSFIQVHHIGYTRPIGYRWNETGINCF